MVIQEADLAAAPITVSDDRREAVDFTVPFMTFGTDILMKKPRAANNATQTSPLPTISSVSDLARQTDIKYGVVGNGRTYDFFHKSQDPSYKQMWTQMSSNPEYGTVPGTREGVRRVREWDGRYVFIIEGTTASYWVQQQPCDLVSVDGKMDRRQYALAVRRGNPLKPKINEALREMEEGRELDQLCRKWWVEKSECSGSTSVDQRHCGDAAGSAIATASLITTLLTVLTAAATPQL